MSVLWEKLCDDEVFFIAEVGKGFIQTEEDRTPEEYLQNAKQLVDEAQRAGADAVKFQTHVVDDEQINIDVTSTHFQGSDRYSWVKRNAEATPPWWWKDLKLYCDEKGILFFSTPMSRGAAELLTEVGVELWKVGSGDILDFVMLDYLRNLGKPIIISSGMSTLAELDQALRFLREKEDQVALLHCVSKYPCPPADVHLNTIPFMQRRYSDLPIGFSDHSIGFDTVRGAVALGAKIVEKHFSLSRDLWGSDHKVSMTPEEFRAMVAAVQNKEYQLDDAKPFLGEEVDGELGDARSEFRNLFRKSIVASRDLPAGTVLTPDMLYAMRPQAYLDGLPSENYEDLIGVSLTREVQKYESITNEHIKQWHEEKDQSRNLIATG